MPFVPVIDESSCVAQGDCAELAPDVFEVRDDLSIVLGAGPLQQLKDAAQACPTEAIAVIDEDTGEQLYP